MAAVDADARSAGRFADAYLRRMRPAAAAELPAVDLALWTCFWTGTGVSAGSALEAENPQPPDSMGRRPGPARPGPDSVLI